MLRPHLHGSPSPWCLILDPESVARLGSWLSVNLSYVWLVSGNSIRRGLTAGGLFTLPELCSRLTVGAAKLKLALDSCIAVNMTR